MTVIVIRTQKDVEKFNWNENIGYDRKKITISSSNYDFVKHEYSITIENNLSQEKIIIKFLHSNLYSLFFKRFYV